MREFLFFKLNNSLILLLVFSSIFSLTVATVSITTDGFNVNIHNDKVKIEFKETFKASSVIVNGQNILSTAEPSFFLDWSDNGQVNLTASELIVVENTTSRAHFYWLQKDIPGFFRIELHYVMVDGLSGIYSWAKFTNDQATNITVAGARTVYRFNPSILAKATNMVRNDVLYTYDYLFEQTKIQDETWQLPDGTYYTKYDFVGYFRKTPYQGVYGNGYGAFLISASREYHGGGPLRQDLMVHQNSLILNVFLSSHLGTAGLSAPPGWTHIYGPWLIYFNTGSDSDILADVQKRAVTEESRWPYKFVHDEEYPVNRGTVYGQVTGQKNASVFLYDSINEDFSSQSLGYLFNTETTLNGSFVVKNIRPGNYKLVAYPLAGQGSENIVIKDVSIQEGDNKDVGTLNLPELENIIWALGETNRRSDTFKYSNELRNYIWSTLPPETLTFTIEESNEATDWYYAQTKPGTWTILYTDTKDEHSRTLRIALAAATKNPHVIVRVNGHKIGNIYGSNDHAIYRSAMQSGTFSSNVLTVTSAQVVSGINNLTLQMSTGELMYDAISLQKNIV